MRHLLKIKRDHVLSKKKEIMLACHFLSLSHNLFLGILQILLYRAYKMICQ